MEIFVQHRHLSQVVSRSWNVVVKAVLESCSLQQRRCLGSASLAPHGWCCCGRSLYMVATLNFFRYFGLQVTGISP